MKSNPTPADVVEAVEQAFVPNLSLTWSPALRGWTPTSMADRIILRQVNNGFTLVRNVNQFRAEHPDLCLETITP